MSIMKICVRNYWGGEGGKRDLEIDKNKAEKNQT